MSAPGPVTPSTTIRAHWTAVLLLTVSSMTAAGLTVAFVHVSAGADLYLALAPLAVSLLIALLSVWAGKVLIEEAQTRAVEQMELLKLKSELAVAQKSRELHHDLVNHLSAVSSWVQLGANDRAVQYIRTILGKVGSEKARAAITDSHGLTILLGMLGQKLDQAAKRNVSYGVELDARSARIEIPDEVAVRVMGNLIDNAIEAATKSEGADGGRIEVGVWVSEEFLRLRVWNNGPPMPQQARRRLLDPGEAPSVVQDRGLGLHIVRTLVKQHNGEFQLNSDASSGTEIIVSFRHLKLPALK